MGQYKGRHHGRFLKLIIDRSKKKTTEIIDLSGYSRSSLYRWFKEEKLDMEKVHRIAIACGIDVDGELPELDYYRKVRQKADHPVNSDESYISQKKYVEVLEELNEVRQQVSDYQEKYFKLKERIHKLEQSKSDSE
ncbi:MAG: hypothetical protein ACQERC_07875 [Bacteroidota bacterium]